MLDRIVFIVEGDMPPLILEQMSGNEGMSRIQIVARHKREWQKDLKESNLKEWENTLFITDSNHILEILQKEGRYTAAYLHSGNQDQNLSATSYAVTDIEEMDYESIDKVFLRVSGRPWKISTTKRCEIRETTVEDVDSFYRIYAEPDITRYMENLFEEPEEEREYTRDYIRKVYGFYGYGLWTIVHKETGEVIGRAGISWREGFEIPELGFVIAVPFWGQGYAYEVCREIVHYGMTVLQFDCIQALVLKENESSVNLCTKLGFVRKDSVEDRGIIYERYIIKRTRQSS